MNSKKPLKEPSFYLDRNIGNKIVPEILRVAGISYQIHDDHLKKEAPDEDWIELCAKKGWIAITLDNRLQHNSLAKSAIKNSTIAIFVITAANITGAILGELIVKNHRKIKKFALGTKKPFIATLSLTGHVSKKNIKF